MCLFRPSADALKPNLRDFHLILAKKFGKKRREKLSLVNYCVSRIGGLSGRPGMPLRHIGAAGQSGDAGHRRFRHGAGQRLRPHPQRVEADAEKLAVLTGKAEDLPSYLQSTTEAMYLYIHTDLTRGRDSGSAIRSDATSSWRRPTGHWSRPATTWPTISATQTTWNAIID